MDEKPKNMKKLTAMETKLFISLIENKRCLYDKDAPGFKDVTVRDKAWQEIHQSMAKPGTNAIYWDDKWKNFKKTFTTNYRDQQQAIQQGGNPDPPTWKWWKQMAFYEPFVIKHQSTPSKGIAVTNNNTPWTLSMPAKRKLIPLDETPPSKKRKTPTGGLGPSGVREEPKGHDISTMNADDIMFLSFAKTFNTFPEERKSTVRKEIFDLIHGKNQSMKKQLKLF